MIFFYLKNCPYCKQAIKWMNELYEENSDYRNIQIDWIEESENMEFAETYDYYYVPCFFDGKTKLHEGAMNKEIIQNIFNGYMRREKE